jgi:hypothetical protein
MPALRCNRQTADLEAELAGLRAHYERLSDTFAGIALLFAAAAALVLFGGWWTREPLFAVSCGFALAGAVAFAVLARAMSKARRAGSRLAPADAVVRFDAGTNWRQAA